MKLSVLISLLPLLGSAKLVFAATETSELTTTETFNDDPLNFGHDQEQSFADDSDNDLQQHKNKFGENLRSALLQELQNRDITKGEGAFKKLLEDKQKRQSFLSHLPKQLDQEIDQRAARKSFDENLRNELRTELQNRDIKKGNGPFIRMLEDQQKKKSFMNSLGTELSKKVVKREPVEFPEELTVHENIMILWGFIHNVFEALIEETNEFFTEEEKANVVNELTKISVVQILMQL